MVERTRKSPGTRPDNHPTVPLTSVPVEQRIPPDDPASGTPLSALIKTQAIEGTGQFSGTVVYVHGIANKPPAATLKSQWDLALFGCDLGERSRMVYWVNRNRYPAPFESASFRPDTSDNAFELVSSDSFPLTESGKADHLGTEREFARQICRGRTDDAERFLDRLIDQIDRPGLSAESGEVRPEILPAPRLVRDWVTRRITRAFLPDVYDYFYDEPFAAAIDRLFRERMASGAGPFIVIGHSLGSVIAYNNLARLSRDGSDVRVRLLVTLGSPLGIREVQDKLGDRLGVASLERPACVEQWHNLADRLDPVAIDPQLANDFGGQNISDTFVRNRDSPRHPHSATGYLQTGEVRKSVHSIVGGGFAQELKDFVIANDVARNIENASSPFTGERKITRQEVLIEVIDDARRSLDEGKAYVIAMLNQIGIEMENVEELHRFVAARLSPSQIEDLASRLKEHRFARIWSDSKKYTLSRATPDVIQAEAAARVYQATGKGITWAVLDTGICSQHPHFANETVEQQFDCTVRGAPQGVESDRLDVHGHGTHVAAIIAGCASSLDTGTGCPNPVSSAPDANLIGYKVLDDHGEGRDSFIIKALQHIATLNDQAGRLRIQGVNLSLGGPFDPDVYGCGHSPICKELRRLWLQGVVVVLAAGNAGFAELQSRRGLLRANMDLSIGDPANLEEAIAVGSVHKSNPWTYGVSYFSSKGPTSDGRQKPDLVAPGEKIISANNQYGANPATWYVSKSGTSMAAPQVSGIIASFLSQRRELIGRPDDVKRILIDNCTDLGRAPEHQGAGMPNLVKMLLAT